MGAETSRSAGRCERLGRQQQLHLAAGLTRDAGQAPGPSHEGALKCRTPRSSSWAGRPRRTGRAPRGGPTSGPPPRAGSPSSSGGLRRAGPPRGPRRQRCSDAHGGPGLADLRRADRRRRRRAAAAAASGQESRAAESLCTVTAAAAPARSWCGRAARRAGRGAAAGHAAARSAPTSACRWSPATATSSAPCASTSRGPRTWTDDDVAPARAARRPGGGRAASWPRSAPSTRTTSWSGSSPSTPPASARSTRPGHRRAALGRPAAVAVRARPASSAARSRRSSSASTPTTSRGCAARCGARRRAVRVVRRGVPAGAAGRAGALDRVPGPGAARRGRHARSARRRRGVRHHGRRTRARPGSRGCWTTMPSAVLHLEPDWRFSYANAEAERLLGPGPRASWSAASCGSCSRPPSAASFERQYRQRRRDRASRSSFDAYYPPPLDAWYEVRAWPTDGGLSRLLHRRHRAARARSSSWPRPPGATTLLAPGDRRADRHPGRRRGRRAGWPRC